MRMSNSILAKRLKELREERGYLQKFVADKLGIRSNTLSGYENGTRSPDPDMLIALSNLYNVTTDYLLGKSDQPHLNSDEAFESFNDPVLERWHRELPKNDEDDLRRLRKMWELMQESKNNKKK